MEAACKSRAAEQVDDLEKVSNLWRKLGHSTWSVKSYRQRTLQFLAAAHVSDYRQLSADRVVRLALCFARKHRHRSPQRTLWRWLTAFRAFAWGLQQLGKPVGSISLTQKTPHCDSLLNAFTAYGRRLGWTPQTLRVHLRCLDYLRRFLVRHRASWPVPRLIDLDHCLQLAAKSWKKSTVSGVAGTFRAWLRFLFVTGRCKQDLASSVALPPSFAFSQPPRALPWSTIRQFGKGIDRSTPIGRRDYAQYLLFCAYGLANAEVIGLKLEAIDWDAGILHIRRVKTGATVDLPLLPVVAKAMVAYLQHGRPQTSCRNVFVRHTIPFGPLSRGTVGARVGCWAERAGVEAPFLGTHLFRHSFATCQLERGTPLKVIGDILGHRCCQTTGIYVRTALARLRQLSLPVPK
jgi:site-specific recombinase XerD